MATYELDSGYPKKLATTMGTIHGAVFGYIGGLLVLGVLQLAADKSDAPLIWALYVIAAATQILVTSAYGTAALNFLIVKSPSKGRLNGWLYAIGALASALISATLMMLVGQTLGALIAAGAASL